MKNILLYLMIVVSLISVSCASQSRITKAQLDNLVQNDQFTFMAQRANPTSYDVLNVLNSMPNSTSTRLLNLDYGYTVQLKDGEVSVDLPYFGRMYNAGYNQTKQGLTFTSKDYIIDKTKNSKGGYTYTILVKDTKHVQNIYLEVFKNGRALVSINSNDRQPISYDGYVMENVKIKK